MAESQQISQCCNRRTNATSCNCTLEHIQQPIHTDVELEDVDLRPKLVAACGESLQVDRGGHDTGIQSSVTLPPNPELVSTCLTSPHRHGTYNLLLQRTHRCIWRVAYLDALTHNTHSIICPNSVHFLAFILLSMFWHALNLSM